MPGRRSPTSMPVLLERQGGSVAATVAHVKVRPTRAGEAHAVTQLGDTEEASAERWKTMPALTVLNMVQTLKPGATALLSGTDERRRERVVLAYQRYGRGKSIAFPVHDSWLWQMHSSIRVDDQTHENFWRQMLRWLVDGVPDAVESRTLTDRVDPGQPVTLTADVVDSRFVELNDADVVAHVTSPSATKVDVPLEWTGERSGQYRATVATDQAGWYEARSMPVGRESRSARRSRTCARRPTMRSISMRRCMRRCCSGSRRRPAAASTRPTPSDRWPRT